MPRIVQSILVPVVEDRAQNGKLGSHFRNADASRLKTLRHDCGVFSNLRFVPPILSNQGRCVFMAERRLYALDRCIKTNGQLSQSRKGTRQELFGRGQRRKSDFKKTRWGSSFLASMSTRCPNSGHTGERGFWTDFPSHSLRA
jgi:hypothetical protein